MSEGKKQFVVDVYWDFARTYKVEAEDPDDAVEKVRTMMLAPGFDPIKEGFEKLDDFEVLYSEDANVDNSQIACADAT